MTETDAPRRPIAFAILLIVFGALGWFSAFQLTVDKFQLLENPDAALNCNFSLIVQCGKNLESWQGALFGFPNPILGLGGFVAPIAVGVAILAGAQFARWFWIAFNVGIAGALALCIWLMSQSIFVLGTLCVWCMLVWAITIPMFWLVTLRNFRDGVLPSSPRARRFFGAAYGWVPVISLACYIVIAVLAQLRLDVLSYL